MGIDWCEKDEFDEVMPCELSDDDLFVVTLAHNPEHAKVTKGGTEHLVDIDQIKTKFSQKLQKCEKECFKSLF